MKVDNPIKTSNGWIHQTSARMVWPNARLVIAISAFGIRKGFRLHGKIDMQRTQSQFQALQKFVNRTFFTAVCCLPLCSQLTLRFAGITPAQCWRQGDFSASSNSNRLQADSSYAR
jgi:hypothetical protein